MGCFQTKRLNCAIEGNIEWAKVKSDSASNSSKNIERKKYGGERYLFALFTRPSILFEIIGADISNFNNEMYVQSSIFRSMNRLFAMKFWKLINYLVLGITL